MNSGPKQGIKSQALDEDDRGDIDNNLDQNEEENGDCENLLQPQEKIGLKDFDLIKVIGRGSFGKVYMVKKTGTESYYAMKKLRKDVVAKRNLFIKTQGKF